MDFKKYIVQFKRVDVEEGYFISQIYARNWFDAEDVIKSFPKYLNDFIKEIFILGELDSEVIVEEGFYLEDNTIQNLDWLFQYFQRDILPKKEKESLKQLLLDMEYYEFLINF